MVRDAIVVGGGVGGLTTAALLTQKGLDVTVFEKSDRLGGRATSYEYESGYVVDYGIHLCRYGGEGDISNVLSRLGVDLDFEGLSHSFRVYEDGVLKGPIGFGRIFLNPLKLKPIIKFLTNINSDYESYLEESFEKWVNENTNDEEIKDLFKMLSTLLIISPYDKYDASFGELIRTLVRVIQTGETVAYPKGGWKKIIQNLESLIEESGSEIRKNTAVEEILIENGKATGIKTKEKEYTAENVILGVRHQKGIQLIDDEYLNNEYWDKSRDIKPTAGISFDIGLEKKVTDAEGLIMSTEFPLMGIATSNIDPSTAPDGKQLLTFLFVHEPSEIKDKKFVKQKVSEYRQVIDKMFPEIEDNKEWERVLRLKCVDGSALTTKQNYKERPDVCTPIDNLFFSTDTCGVPGGGGDISFLAAEKVADLII